MGFRKLQGSERDVSTADPLFCFGAAHNGTAGWNGADHYRDGYCTLSLFEGAMDGLTLSCRRPSQTTSTPFVPSYRSYTVIAS